MIEMKKEYRVKRNEDFQAIIHKKKSVVNRVFVVYYQTGAANHMRIGISVSKKLGNAVERNKIKRQLRMMLMEICDINVPIDLVVIVRNNFTQQDYATNKKDLLHVLKKVKMEERSILSDKENILNEEIK